MLDIIVITIIIVSPIIGMIIAVKHIGAKPSHAVITYAVTMPINLLLVHWIGAGWYLAIMTTITVIQVGATMYYNAKMEQALRELKIGFTNNS